MQAKQSHFLPLELLIQLEKVSSLPESSSAAPTKGVIVVPRPQQSSGCPPAPASALLVPMAGTLCTEAWKEKDSGKENFEPKG